MPRGSQPPNPKRCSGSRSGSDKRLRSRSPNGHANSSQCERERESLSAEQARREATRQPMDPGPAEQHRHYGTSTFFARPGDGQQPAVQLGPPDRPGQHGEIATRGTLGAYPAWLVQQAEKSDPTPPPNSNPQTQQQIAGDRPPHIGHVHGPNATSQGASNIEVRR